MGKRLDLTGRTFGRWTVLGRAPNKGSKTAWHCKCSCGTEKDVVTTSLTQGLSISCGCLRLEEWRKSQDSKSASIEQLHSKDLLGKRFDKLLVVSYTGDNKWKCRCDCGQIVTRTRTTLLHNDNNVHSCNKCVGARFIKDITNIVFNDTIIAVERNSINGLWKCKCNLCGNYFYADIGDLPRTKSCGCINIAKSGSSAENRIVSVISNTFPNLEIVQHDRGVLSGREIDIYLPQCRVGIEYNGSAFHATENGVYDNKDKYYHRDKFLLAKVRGVQLFTVFDVDDLELSINRIIEYIRGKEYPIPNEPTIITNNDYDNGLWLLKHNYICVKQLEPESYISNSFLVYRCGSSLWVRRDTASESQEVIDYIDSLIK